jgi:hypothetical protein
VSVTLDLNDITVQGSAITQSFLHDGLASCLARLGTLPSPTIPPPASGRPRILATALGYSTLRRQDPIVTREGAEDGGWLMQADGGSKIRLWSLPSSIDLDTGGRAAAIRVAQRVLLAQAEPAGLLTNGQSLRLLLSDAARGDSFIAFPLRCWRDQITPPDSWRALLALAGAHALPCLPDILNEASTHQVRVTTELRRQAREAILGFINALPSRQGLDPRALWRDSLLLIYRLLFILKLEAMQDGSGFATTTLWRSSLSPSQALGPLVRQHLDRGVDTARMLEDGLRTLFALLRDGLTCNQLRIAPLGGSLFGDGSLSVLEHIDWGDRAVAILLDKLIWISGHDRQLVRVHYGSLDVEDLGSIYESLLEQEPGIATQPMIRQRRGKLEAIVPANGAPAHIEPGAFFLRAGSGRKASGSYYTPQEFVQFLVRETLAPHIAARSPRADPNPAELLRIRFVDPAMGSGHFLVEACRQLAEAVLTACIDCDSHGRVDGRMAALSDLIPYLPSHGFAESRARAICRRLVAVHCLYGCDRNELAVELAKLSLWLESHAEGLPLTFLDHRLVAGNALTGPFFDRLATLPVTGGPLDPLLARGVAERLNAALVLARRLIISLNASVGRDIDDLLSKQAAKQQLDLLLYPLRELAKAWAGAAMLQERDADDIWLSLAQMVADSFTWPARPTRRQQRLIDAGCEAVPWDLTFPEVFPDGFTVILGNPPWDVVLPNTKDFLSAYDLTILDATSRTARATIAARLLSRPDIKVAFDTYRTGFDRLKNAVPVLYRHQRAGQATGSLDLYRLFAERGLQLAAADGAIGWVLPSSFHANEGSTAVRRAYLEFLSLDWLLSFENRRRTFDIDSRYKFDLLVGHRPRPTRSFRCGFYLDRIQDAGDTSKIMTYDAAFLARTSGDRLSPLELRGGADLRLAEQLFVVPHRLGPWCAARHIRFGCDLHMTHDSGIFAPPAEGTLILHEGKTFHQYTDSRDTRPRYGVRAESLPSSVARAAAHSRLAFRDIARSNDTRTMIAFMAPPGVVFGHTATVEKTPWARPIGNALLLCALFNSFCFDWLVRQKAATHLSLYLIEGLPVPDFDAPQQRFLADAARRLSARPNATLRAVVDACVARAYGLDRAAFGHLLSGFSHKENRDAPAQCLAAFDAGSANGAALVA